jgi:hypothetical protein
MLFDKYNTVSTSEGQSRLQQKIVTGSNFIKTQQIEQLYQQQTYIVLVTGKYDHPINYIEVADDREVLFGLDDLPEDDLEMHRLLREPA